MTGPMTLLFAVAGGAAVGNLYWAQPLLEEIAASLGVPAAVAGLLVTVTQIGYAVGIFLYMCLIPAVEAAEQTVIQRVVPLERQGRVFGFAMAVETAAAPLTAFLIAGLAWGLSGDQRLDDARSLTWDVAPPAGPVVGYPVARLRVSASAPAASLSVKLCDVFTDGTSALVSRGSLDLAFRSSVHGQPEALVPGEVYDVEVVLDACAYEWSAGQVLRVSVAGSDWPNTIAPPAPVTLTVHAAEVSLHVLDGSWPAPTFDPGAEHTTESAEGIAWEIHDDVLARTTTAAGQSSP